MLSLSRQTFVVSSFRRIAHSVRFDASVQVYREGVGSELPAQRSHRFSRLDVIACPSATKVLIGDNFAIAVPAAAVLTHASLAALVVDPLADHLEQLITRALDNDTAALAELELLLPIAHARVQARLLASPDAAGAPALRTVVITYAE